MHKRSSINAGIIMIVVGVSFLLINAFPETAAWLNISRQWPLIIVAVGLLFLVSALVNVPALAIPGSILTGIGSLLYYQNSTGNWASWSYAWALIPAFVGIGMLLSGALSRSPVQRREGVRLIGIGGLLFLVFSALFTGWLNLTDYWPVLLILLGIWIIIRRRS